MHATLTTLIGRLAELGSGDRVISWGAPIPVFGDPASARVATVGLNPSNREFMDAAGVELEGEARRFHTLRSLELDSWDDVAAEHLSVMIGSYMDYFRMNPYDLWFKRLDRLLVGTETSYYPPVGGACHLDLIPFATACKWTELTGSQRARLVEVAGDTLGVLVRDSAIRLVILNGRSVVDVFEHASEVVLERRRMARWALQRSGRDSVNGIAFKGRVTSIGRVDLEREVTVLGFNHNVQSSFGVTRGVLAALTGWIEREAEDALT
jgi:hypothetical protein